VAATLLVAAAGKMLVSFDHTRHLGNVRGEREVRW
jgi:hypothetical protein